MPVSVSVGENEHIERALKRFRKACEDEGLISELRNRQTYIKSSDKKRAKKADARRKQLRAMRKDHAKEKLS